MYAVDSTEWLHLHLHLLLYFECAVWQFLEYAKPAEQWVTAPYLCEV